MKICFLSSKHPAFDKRVFDKEAVYLAREGHDVMHLCPDDMPCEFTKKDVKVKTYLKPKGLVGRISQLWSLYRLARKIDCNVYHCNEVDSWLIGVILKLTTGRLCVFDVHEHYPSNFASQYFPKFLRPIAYALIILIFRLLLPFTSRLVLAKKSVSADFPMSEEKKILVRNFTPLSGVKFAGSREVASKDSKITLIHFGLFSKIRGWPQTLAALKNIHNKNARLIIIGEFNDGSRSEFENAVNDYKLCDRVIVYDWMPFEEAFQHLTQAHIGLIVFQPGIMNHVYAMPHKLFDYMAAGMAVICPNFAVEIVPFIKDSECGLLADTSDPDDLTDKIDRLIDSPELIRDMGARGQQAVRDHFNWELEAMKLIEMYKRLESRL